jgi:endoglycosylceramidase
VRWEGSTVVPDIGVSTHLNLVGCPGDELLGPNEDFLEILGRGYPRAAPGRLDEVRSDPDTGWLKVRATAAEAGGELVVWTPTEAGPDHEITVQGLTEVVEHQVPGGRIITARVEAVGPYALWVGEPDAEPAPPTDGGGSGGSVAPPAAPVPGQSRYTG